MVCLYGYWEKLVSLYASTLKNVSVKLRNRHKISVHKELIVNRSYRLLSMVY